MPTLTKRNGETVTWSALGVCYCLKCEELFNSEAAFNKHLHRRKHVHPEKAGMAKNAKGYWVTSLRR